MATKDILVKLRLAGEDFSAQFRKEFEKLEQESERAGAESSAAMARGFNARGAALIGAIGAAAVAGVQAVKQSLELARDLDVTSKQLGVGVEALQQWRFAASKAGLEAQEFDANVGDLTRKIGEAVGGTRAAQQAFVDLGVGFATTSGQARATDAVLLDIVKRFESIESPAERARLGVALFGEDFRVLEPLLLGGADGLRAATGELEQFGGALSSEEIRNLQDTNAKIERMKTVLSIRIASVVAENADAIVNLTSGLLDLGTAAVQAASGWLDFLNATREAKDEIATLPDTLSPAQRAAAENEARQNKGLFRTNPGGIAGVLGFREQKFDPTRIFTDSGALTDAGLASLNQFFKPRGGILPEDEGVRPPSLSPPPSRSGSSRARKSAEERDAERALKAEQALTEQIERTLQAQRDSVEVEETRAREGEVAAAAREAELAFLRQHPKAQLDTVEALGAALGMSEKMIAARKEELGLIIKQGDEAQANAVAAATAEAQAELDRKKKREEEEFDRDAERQAELFRRAQQQAIRDVADLYEDLFHGGVDSVWRRFKAEGLRIIAEVAGQFTLALLSGQRGPNLGASFGSAVGRSPLSVLLGGGVAANDNGPTPVAATAGGGGLFTIPAGGGPVPIPQTGGSAAGTQSLLDQAGFAIAAATVGSLLGGGGAGSQLGSLAGSLGGQALGSGIAALGKAGGPIGALAGALLGSALGGLLGGSQKGGVTLSGSSITSTFGKTKFQQNGTQAAGSVFDTLASLAEALGGTLNAGAGSVSIGERKGSIRVDPTGSGQTKTGRGAIDFGGDMEAAIAFAIRDLIEDGVLGGISQASLNILKSGQDLEAAIEKAVLIESVPKLLKQRLDPLGFAMDELFDRFKKLADAMREGGASLEQIAQARQLFELEKADAIAAIGGASAELKDFLLSLNAGSNSPLSLRQQRAAAEEQLAPFVAQIEAANAAQAEVDRLKASGASAAEIAAAEEAARAAAGQIDQAGFTEASQLLLGISRQANASSGAFFSDFDRIRALTGQGIGLIDGATAPVDNRDPFAELTARNTTDMANILADHTRLLQAINDNLSSGATIDLGGFLTQNRMFA